MPLQDPSEPAATVVAADEPKNSDAGATAEDRVGYGRPPVATRFKPGKSGNPRGRPKGARSVGAILQDVVRQKVSITENGKTRRVPVIEGMLRRLANAGLRGDARVVKLLLSLLDRYGDSTEATVKLADMLAEDREILAQYLQPPQGQQLASSDKASSPFVDSKPKRGGEGDDGAD
jgi:hypothetical protein